MSERYLLEFSWEGLAALWGMAEISASAVNSGRDQCSPEICETIDATFRRLEEFYGVQEVQDRVLAATKIYDAAGEAAEIINEALDKAVEERSG